MKRLQVNTGQGMISAIAVVAIWSLSLTVNLPGLAVTPMLDSLSSIFGNVSRAEVQLLTVLPNVLIIPFVLLSGKLSESPYKLKLVLAALLIYLAAGILYLVTDSMAGLIWISCLLGVGCGILIPFSTGLVADVFVGKYRMRQMGIISAIGNLALVAATFIVGVLAAINWHYPFLVYLIPIVPLALSPWLRKLPKVDLSGATSAEQAEDSSDAPSPSVKVDAKGGFYIKRTVSLLLSYFYFMGLTAIILNFLPFLMEGRYAMSSTEVGSVTSILFVGMMLGGFLLTPTLRALKGWTYCAAVILLVAGCILLAFTRSFATLAVGAFMTGLANGTIQPIIYDKATEIVSTPRKSTLALAIIMAANYAAVALAPELVDFIGWVFGIHNNLFAFIITLIMSAVIAVVAFLGRNGFTFGIRSRYYS